MAKSIFEKPRARGEECCWCDRRATHCLATIRATSTLYEPACADHLALIAPPTDQDRLYRLPRL